MFKWRTNKVHNIFSLLSPEDRKENEILESVFMSSIYCSIFVVKHVLLLCILKEISFIASKRMYAFTIVAPLSSRVRKEDLNLIFKQEKFYFQQYIQYPIIKLILSTRTFQSQHVNNFYEIVLRVFQVLKLLRDHSQLQVNNSLLSKRNKDVQLQLSHKINSTFSFLLEN